MSNLHKCLRRPDLQILEPISKISEKNNAMLSILNIGKKPPVLNADQQKNKELLELDKTLYEQENYTKEALNTLISNVNIWKNKYLIKAEQDGRIYFQKTLQENQAFA